jgi:hypothetical protein
MKKFRKDTGTKSALPSGRPTDFGKAGARECFWRCPMKIYAVYGVRQVDF